MRMKVRCYRRRRRSTARHLENSNAHVAAVAKRDEESDALLSWKRVLHSPRHLATPSAQTTSAAASDCLFAADGRDFSPLVACALSQSSSSWSYSEDDASLFPSVSLFSTHRLSGSNFLCIPWYVVAYKCTLYRTRYIIVYTAYCTTERS